MSGGESGRVRKCSESHRSGLVGSGQVGSGRVWSGWVGLGRVALTRRNSRETTRLVNSPGIFFAPERFIVAKAAPINRRATGYPELCPTPDRGCASWVDAETRSWF